MADSTSEAALGGMVGVHCKLITYLATMHDVIIEITQNNPEITLDIEQYPSENQ